MVKQRRVTFSPGDKFGRLTLIEKVPSKSKNSRWQCRCDCGQIKEVVLSNLSSGNTKSCGCLNRELTADRNSTHGATRGYKPTKAYAAWLNMRRRCYDPLNKRFAQYGGRGIFVCDRWLVFENFLADMGQAPSPKHSIDRVDNNGPYSPENCRWATKSEQNRNTRRARLITYNGETKNLCDWAKETGLAFDTLAARLDLYGMSVEEALTKPLHRRSRPWGSQT